MKAPTCANLRGAAAAPPAAQLRRQRGANAIAPLPARAAAQRLRLQTRATLAEPAVAAPAAADAPPGFFLDEEALLAASTFPISPAELVEKCKACLLTNFGTSQPELLAEDFQFGAPGTQGVLPVRVARAGSSWRAARLTHVGARCAAAPPTRSCACGWTTVQEGVRVRVPGAHAQPRMRRMPAFTAASLALTGRLRRTPQSFNVLDAFPDMKFQVRCTALAAAATLAVRRARRARRLLRRVIVTVSSAVTAALAALTRPLHCVQYHHLRVDPLEPCRVWYTARAVGTNTGAFAGALPPTNKRVESPPQSCSMVFNASGQCTKLTVGYTMDRQLGNTGGLCVPLRCISRVLACG
jgi:hypothetical protein